MSDAAVILAQRKYWDAVRKKYNARDGVKSDNVKRAMSILAAWLHWDRVALRMGRGGRAHERKSGRIKQGGTHWSQEAGQWTW